MRPRPMAVVGPLRSSVSDIVSTLGTTRGGGSGGIPNISPTTRSSRLDNTEQRPFFGRTSTRILERRWPFVSTYRASMFDNSQFFMWAIITALIIFF
jgi:hypothetical protein